MNVCPATHRRALLAILAAAFALVAVFACGGPNLADLAEQAVAARTSMMQEEATAADVDRFLSFATDDVVYEDPVVKMRNQGKENLRKGMTAFLGATRNARTVVTRRIAAANVVVLQQTVTFEYKQDDGSWKPSRRDQVTVFEFDGPKIRRIADYWAR
ncbi:MAG TPA: nuclear transport factor 2 family protein [Thermoanaerobaculia bacterium]|jgi:ketosteroid isomerase-like protein